MCVGRLGLLDSSSSLGFCDRALSSARPSLLNLPGDLCTSTVEGKARRAGTKDGMRGASAPGAGLPTQAVPAVLTGGPRPATLPVLGEDFRAATRAMAPIAPCLPTRLAPQDPAHTRRHRGESLSACITRHVDPWSKPSIGWACHLPPAFRTLHRFDHNDATSQVDGLSAKPGDTPESDRTPRLSVIPKVSRPSLARSGTCPNT